MDQLEKQLDKDEFQEIRSMTAFKVLETQFHTFIKSRIYLDDEYVIMTRKYFLDYTQPKIREFRDALMQHMEYVKKSIDKRALHKRDYESRLNERQIHTKEEKVDTSKALDASLVNIESGGTKSRKKDTNITSWNDVDADDANIKPIYDEDQWLRNISKNMPRFSLNGMVHSQSKRLPLCMRKQRLLDHVLGGNQRVKFLRLLVLDGFQLERYSSLAQPRLIVNPPHCSKIDITNLHEHIQTLDSSAGTSINLQEERNLDLSAGTPLILKKERIKAWIK
uniref:Uncharacterized protein n=1 Tax=Tanacetum cinerariifolium TaxID=118510 RepID=A0A6L2LLR9_TANCI|nr:hypothetical protein [Tanacetum cinerariifolium]